MNSRAFVAKIDRILRFAQNASVALTNSKNALIKTTRRQNSARNRTKYIVTRFKNGHENSRRTICDAVGDNSPSRNMAFSRLLGMKIRQPAVLVINRNRKNTHPANTANGVLIYSSTISGVSKNHNPAISA